jgi:site-specific DNA-cytosine methylase
VPWRGWYAAIEDLLPTLPESRFADWQLRRLPPLLTCAMVQSKNNNEWGDGTRSQDAPSFTVMTDGQPAHAPKAFLVHNQISQAADAPMVRADGQTNGDGERMTVRCEDDPAFTVVASSTKRPARAWLDQGRVVSLTPRALARLQTFPDWYALPDSRTLACRVIGNAAPPLLAQRLLEDIAACLDTREERTA